MRPKMISFFIYLLLCVALLVALFLLFPENIVASKKMTNDSIRKPDELLVKFKEDDEINHFKITQKEDFYKILEYWQELPEVEYVEPNYIYRASIIPSDTFFSNQWHLQKIKATKAWDKVRESPEIIIAIIDSGVQISHPDLESNIWRNGKEIADNNIDDDRNGFIDDINGWDFVNNVADPAPKFNLDYTEDGILHGTIVAGIAAASGNNAAGIAGITWRAQIMPLKVLDDRGEGDTMKVIKAIDYAIANGADIINLSFVGFGYSKSLESAIRRAYEADIIIVAAGGNEQEEGSGYYLDEVPMYPICHDGFAGENMVIGVAATDTLDQKTSFSGYGFKCIDIAAPGLSIYSTVVYSPTDYVNGKSFNKYYDGYWSGTSVAVPIVSGAAALIAAANPRLNRDQVVEILHNSADNINRLNPDYLNKLGSGRLNVELAVTQAQNYLKNKTEELIVAPFSDYVSSIKITDQDGKIEKEFYSYNEEFLGGVNISSGDIDGDGKSEIITGAGPGGGPHVRIFSSDGRVLGQFFAYAENFRGGVNVAVVDVDNDGKSEIITGAGPGGEPQVKIFNYQGEIKNSFFVYDKKFRGGVYVASGDIDGDGKNEIITGAGPGGGPQVRIFSSDGKVLGQFFAYAENFRGGVRVAVADIDGGVRKNKSEIITGAGPGGGPHVRVFDNKANVLAQFFAFNNNFRGGINLAAGDIDNDGLDEIITGAGPGGGPHVRVFEVNGKIIGSFYAFENTFSGGVNVGVIKKTF